MKKSFVHIYTGNGKGKTTAAIGLAVRSLGADKRVAFIQFMKGNIYSEQTILNSISANLDLKIIGKPYFVAFEGEIPNDVLKNLKDECVVFKKGYPPIEYVKLIDEGVCYAEECICSGRYHIVVLDEIICAIYFGLVSEKRILEIINKQNKNTEIILTGRNASETLINNADLVTEMKEIKHYYKQGVEARRGIEC